MIEIYIHSVSVVWVIMEKKKIHTIGIRALLWFHFHQNTFLKTIALNDNIFGRCRHPLQASFQALLGRRSDAIPAAVCSAASGTVQDTVQASVPGDVQAPSHVGEKRHFQALLQAFSRCPFRRSKGTSFSRHSDVVSGIQNDAVQVPLQAFQRFRLSAIGGVAMTSFRQHFHFGLRRRS